jgi:RNA polymerase sigma-B factor
MDPYRSNALSQTDTIEMLTSVHRATGAERSRLEEDIVRAYQPMARRLASRFSGYGADIDDLMQVANMAVVKAIRGFDPERGAFQSYAKATIDGELKKHLRDYCWSIKPPRRVQELQSQIMRRTEAMAQTQGVLPRTADLADAMDATVSDITEALSARSCYSPSSLDRPAGAAGRPLAENLADAEEPYERVDGWVSLIQICSDLDQDDKTLLRLRFYECMSQREIAEELGVSQMQVSRRLARLLSGLRSKALESEVA